MPGEFDTEQFMGLTPDQEEALLMAGEGDPDAATPPAQGAETAPPAGQAGAPDPAADQQQIAAAPADVQEQQRIISNNGGSRAGEGQDRGDQSVPIGALRAQNRDLANQNAQLMGMIQALQQGQQTQPTQPQGAAPQAAQQGAEDDGPRFAVEDPEQIARAIEHHPAVVEARQAAQMFKGMMAAQAKQAELAEVTALDPDAPSILAEFDQAVPPEYAQLPAKARYYLAKGILTSSPDYQAQQQRATAEQARELAINATADALKAPGTTPTGAPPNIGTLPGAQPNQASLPQGDLSFQQWQGLSDDQEEAMLGRGQY